MKRLIIILLFSLPSLAINPFVHYSFDFNPALGDYLGYKLGNSTLLLVFFERPIISDLPPGSWNCSNTVFLADTNLSISLDGIIGLCNVSEIMDELKSLTQEEPSFIGYFIYSERTLIVEKQTWEGRDVVDSYSFGGVPVYELDSSDIGIEGSGSTVLNDSGVYLYIVSDDINTARAIACNITGCYSILGWYALILIAFIALAIFLFRHNRTRLHRIR